MSCVLCKLSWWIVLFVTDLNCVVVVVLLRVSCVRCIHTQWRNIVGLRPRVRSFLTCACADTFNNARLAPTYRNTIQRGCNAWSHYQFESGCMQTHVRWAYEVARVIRCEWTMDTYTIPHGKQHFQHMKIPSRRIEILWQCRCVFPLMHVVAIVF